MASKKSTETGTIQSVKCDDCGDELFFKQEGSEIRTLACQTCVGKTYDAGGDYYREKFRV